jgi:DNA mismatch repair protein MutL
MAKIKLLDEETINQIAAGEVIERPASAVKELVENSIDAGARRILVGVEDGGKSLIKVTDDGSGIDAQDLPLAFKKHATSKISGAHDLATVTTLGFRGEALSSIASVSRRLAVFTKTREAAAGTYMLLEKGTPVELKEAGCPAGTSIAVHDLFYHIPARRKHLRGAEAELAEIAELITRLAIINFGISFELFTGRRTIFKSIRSQSWDDALFRVFGLQDSQRFIPFGAKGKGWSLEGMAGDPLSTRSSPDRIFIYINGRPVAARALMLGYREAYRNLIPAGRSPIGVLSLRAEPVLVDVNVHPAKREVRLLSEEEIAAALTQAVSSAIKAGARPPEKRPMAMPPQMPLEIGRGEQSTLPLESADEVALPSHPALSKITILGQVLDLYIVAEGEQGLMLIDQHAAAERISFERLAERYRAKSISQELALPVTIELAPSEQILLEAWKETLADMGFEIAPFGGATYQVRAVPAIGSRLESPETLHDLLKDLFSLGRMGGDATAKEEILKLLACRGSIKSGMKLDPGRARLLLKDLFACNNPLTCPHGRPVMVVIDRGQLETLFARR